MSAVILAAGASRRLGRPKQLVPYRGEALLARVVRLAWEAGMQAVVVVLGARAEEIEAAVNLRSVLVVRNADWEQGIASSIHAGLHAAGDCDGVLLLTCDQPLLSAEYLRGLFAQFTGQQIAASAYAGVHGVPAIFPRAAFADLLALRGDKGARVLFAAPPCPVVAIDFPGGEVDVDTPQDLERLM